MNAIRQLTRSVIGILVMASLASCSKERGGALLDPGPGPTPSDADGFFVNAAIGHDDSAGTQAAPFRTIRRAIEAARVTRGDVFVASGVYPNEAPFVSLILKPGVSLHGGYDGITWQRDPVRNVTEIVGMVNAANLPAVDFFHSDSATIDGFTIRSPDQTAPGSSSTCIRVTAPAKGVVISNNILIAGRGADGRDGSATTWGSGARQGGDGSAPFYCSGGEGGTAAFYEGGEGGDGGDGAVYFANDGWDGARAGDGYGEGGMRGTVDSPSGKNGQPGAPGVDGLHGRAGDAVGVIDGYGYVPASGLNGGDGIYGGGGGGGGGAHGQEIACGAGGGGGGAGGRGGAGGTGGGGGAGSFGVVVTGDCTAEILNNRVTTAAGGNGGDGGLGAGGHAGAPGGVGGQLVLFPSGGIGGTGGNGGNGGHGGPGGGGPSLGIVEAPNALTARSGNVFSIGSGGTGGSAAGGGQPDAPDGIALEYRKFE